MVVSCKLQLENNENKGSQIGQTKKKRKKKRRQMLFVSSPNSN
jgi:hypothetical protein